MNLLHLKYAVEVEKTRSINKAAENLYMGQPNLSRAIKELEESLHVKIFKRTSKGISLTPQGEEFMQYAKRIIAQIDEVEAMYRSGSSDKQTFSISVPRASYISCAFTEFAGKLDSTVPAELQYKETNAMRAVNNIMQFDYKLGILRYQPMFDHHFDGLMREKGLSSRLICEFSPVLILSKQHPLAQKERVDASDLETYTEIAYPDPYIPSLSLLDAKKTELTEGVQRRIFVFERGSQLDLLSHLQDTFSWGAAVPGQILKQYDLIQKRCSWNCKRYKDVLIYRKGYPLSSLDHEFLRALERYKPMDAE